MWMRKKNKTKEARLREYDRLMLRSSFVSLFWAAIAERKRHGKFALQEIADYIGTNKSVVSRWFSNSHPNWEIDSIADIAGSLNLELKLQALDRETGAIITPSGVQKPIEVQHIQIAAPEIEESKDTEPVKELLVFGSLPITSSGPRGSQAA